MRLTYYAITISFIAAVLAVPVEITASQSDYSRRIDLHARKSQLLTKLRPYFKKLPPQSVSGLSVITATSNEGKSHSTEESEDSVGSSKVTIQLWSPALYREFQRLGEPSLQGVVIHDDRPCNARQKADIERTIIALIRQAAQSSGGLRFKRGRLLIPDFKEGCQAQWLPVYNYFFFNVENGDGGQCENEPCEGMIFVQSGNGFIKTADRTVFDSTVRADYDLFNAHHATLRSH